MATRRTQRAERANCEIEERPTQPNTKPINNALKLKLDHLKSFEPLTENQRKFYDAYKRGDYFIALHGVAGTGKAFTLIEFTVDDIVRSSLVRDWIIACNNLGIDI